jgi:hypothetical protein
MHRSDSKSPGTTQRAEFGVAQKSTELQSHIGDATCLPLIAAEKVSNFLRNWSDRINSWYV